MHNLKLNTVSESVKTYKEYSLDEALNVVGLGWYNVLYCLVLAMCLISSIMEVIGYSYVLPAARCDLDMTDTQRGVIASLPYAAMILTAFLWGYLVDTKGRRIILIWSCSLCGFFGILAGFMPELITFTAFKFIASLCLACSSNIPYAFIGEITPPRHRDIALSVTNALQISGAGFVPVLAWAILPLDFRLDFGAYDFRPWRLLTMVYSCTFLLCALLMYLGSESPKYLISKGKHDEALAVLRKMYAINKRQSSDEFPIKRLIIPVTNVNNDIGFFKSIKHQSLPLLKPPHIKWMALNGLLLFGIFSSLNGLFMWVPDILNRIFSGNAEIEGTACYMIRQGIAEDQATAGICVDTIDPITYRVNTIANFACAALTLVISSTLKFISKKVLLIAVFVIMGTLSMLNNVVTSQIGLAVTLTSIQLLGVGIGPVNAYAVELFPTNLRGMAVSLTMMVGRLGSVAGTNSAGFLINNICEATFYVFGGLLFVCGLAALLLPKSKGI